ncbi:conserved hypothetical protein [Histoplasma capsulatum H143]|uniref:Uncharacterized protein n=1 Tax=Ajellomyces capsulatus (strain H143) TaxID=544712 RepID=C6HSZ0_AJECH|nr:conserved hypothetical protein [Histoplasma capsulatum H143]
MFILQTLSAVASRLKLPSYKRTSSSFQASDHIRASSTAGKIKTRITRLSSRSWRTKRPSNCKAAAELVYEASSPGASHCPSNPLTSSDIFRHAIDSSSELLTQVYEASNIAEEVSITDDPSSPVEVSTSPVIQPRYNNPATQDDDIERGRMVLFCAANTASPVDSPLVLTQQEHASQIAALIGENAKLRAVVDERDKCMEQLKSAREDIDTLERSSNSWRDKFFTKLEEANQLRRDKYNLEIVAKNHRNAQLEEMRQAMGAYESQLTEVREELKSRCQEIKLLREENKGMEESSWKQFQEYHDLAQDKEELQKRYKQLKAQVEDNRIDRLRLMEKIEQLEATESELAARLTAAEISTREHAEREEKLERRPSANKNFHAEYDEKNSD